MLIVCNQYFIPIEPDYNYTINENSLLKTFIPSDMYGLLVCKCMFDLSLIEFIFDYASVVMCVMLLFNLFTTAFLVK